MFSCPDGKDSGLHFHNTTDDSFVGRIAYDHNSTGDNMLFTVNSSEAMRIDSAGDVGIGTTDPTSKLHVVGQDVTFYSDTGNQSLQVGRNANERTEIFINDLQNKITAVNDADNNDPHKFILNRAFGGTGANTFEIQKDGTTQLLIDTNGNAGIGTTNPQTELHVKGTNGWGEVRVEGQTLASGHGAAVEFYSEGTALADIYANTNKGLYFRTNGTTESMRINSQGQTWLGGSFTGANIANGSATYLNNLNAGGFSVLHRNSADVYLHFNSYYTSSGTYISKYEARSAFRIDAPGDSNGGLNFFKAPAVAVGAVQTFSEVMRMGYGANNNVGIGITAPAAKLDVLGETRISYASGSQYRFRLTNSDGNGRILVDGESSSLIFGTSPSGANATAAERMRINPDGAIRFNAYGAGTLVTDASGNITVSSGGGAGGPYLPLTGGTLTGDLIIESALLSNQENTDVDTGTETVASVLIATYTAAFFDFVIKNGTNLRAGTVFACHDGTNVVYTETSTNDLGDTSDVTLSVDISGTDMRLRATVTSDDWIIKSLIRAI
jgi:hypothetical protein